MISFYPGPSKLFPEVRQYLTDIYDSGILSVNHRSPEFVALSQSCIGLLKKQLQIPEDYTIFFTSSATECWEIIAQSLIKESSWHLYNGAFGEKWADYTQAIVGEEICHRLKFELNEILIPEKLTQLKQTCLIALTHNETSNASCLPDDVIEELRIKYPKPLIAIDATSSMGGVKLPFRAADIWFASVQKCFGLPAGMAIMICSPRVKTQCIHPASHYNSLSAMFEKMEFWQTTYTPNVLAIALLDKVLKNRDWNDQHLKKRAKDWYQFITDHPKIGNTLVTSPSVQSATVIAVTSSEEHINQIKIEAKAAGFLLGNGYGEWAKNTFRIANFPAISDEEIDALKKWMLKY